MNKVLKVMVRCGSEQGAIIRPEIDGGTTHFGAYVAHDDPDSRPTCSITHRGTGLSIAVTKTAKAARCLMERLESLPVDWGFRKLGRKHAQAYAYLAGLSMAERRPLLAVYRGTERPVKVKL